MVQSFKFASIHIKRELNHKENRMDNINEYQLNEVVLCYVIVRGQEHPPSTPVNMVPYRSKLSKPMEGIVVHIQDAPQST